AAGERARLSVERATRQAELARLARTAQVVTVGAPAVVVDALWRAQQRMAAERPGCGVRWSLLAAISQVESGHGGGRVDASGQASPVILGPVLDGTVFSLILDTDGGALDADTVHDRAVGPMQFIPTSWAIYARDGNGDGRRDPSNYYDAALAAAEHLCRAGHDHRDPGGVSRAVFGYNRSPAYNAKVLALADEYGAVRLR
ncbi:MAG: lytic transglycosylase domain-containing protein, partial [Acidimicrobiales bacterium]